MEAGQRKEKGKTGERKGKEEMRNGKREGGRGVKKVWRGKGVDRKTERWREGEERD